MDEFPIAARAWTFELCDSCRILLRNVIFVALHRLSHEELVAAVIQAMSARGLNYSDLMKPLVEIKALESASKGNVSHT